MFKRTWIALLAIGALTGCANTDKANIHITQPNPAATQPSNPFNVTSRQPSVSGSFSTTDIKLMQQMSQLSLTIQGEIKNLFETLTTKSNDPKAVNTALTKMKKELTDQLQTLQQKKTTSSQLHHIQTLYEENLKSMLKEVKAIQTTSNTSDASKTLINLLTKLDQQANNEGQLIQSLPHIKSSS